MGDLVLVDTSVWVSHLRGTHDRLAPLLEDGAVACHPFIIGELAVGNLRNRQEILSLLGELPVAQIVEHEEALAFAGARKLAGKGLGWVDVHVLASAVVSGFALWTEDKRLAQAAARLGAKL